MQRSLLLKLLKYSSLLAKRIYRPVKPAVNPLLKKIKLVYWLIALVIIGVVGNWQYWQEKKEYLEATDKKEVLEKEIKIWETTLLDMPDYKDVYLRLGLLNWKINNQEQAKANWERANYLDPNDKTVQQAGEVIFSVLLFSFLLFSVLFSSVEQQRKQGTESTSYILCQ